MLGIQSSTFGSGSKIRIEGVTKEELSEEDFLFVNVAEQQAPIDISLSNSSVKEGSAVGTSGRYANCARSRSNSTFTFKMVDDAGGLFGITATN